MSNWRQKLLSTTALTRRWEDPMKFAGDMYLAGNFTLAAQGGVGLNPYDLSSAIAFFMSAGCYSLAGNSKNFVKAGLAFSGTAMSILWAGAIAKAGDTGDGIMQAIEKTHWGVHAGNAVFVGSQLYSIIAPGYTVDTDKKRSIPEKLKDVVLAKPLQVTGLLALGSKIPLLQATFARLHDPKETVASVFFLGVLTLWSLGDIALYRANKINQPLPVRGGR
jgi:fermentation-respiration switch protein FrsA (DUF1100 family)